ncbi:MAG: hypothetical protein HRU20_25245, partial [Pseudomonadales bacterium]|nr:hypothetical protein [Pseudomonadales bacterium]
MMTPDILDPNWLEEREILWSGNSQVMSENFTKKDLAFIKPMFFEAHFDYGNRKKYGRFSEDYLMAFIFCPVQTSESWQRWFSEDLPNWLGERVEIDLESILFKAAFRKYSYVSVNGWSLDTTVELFKFCYGDRITLGPYQFLNYKREKHPLLGLDGVKFYTDWLISFVAWLKGFEGGG